MECKNIQSILPSYVDNTGNADDTAAIESHLATCDTCRKYLSNLLDNPGAVKAQKAADTKASVPDKNTITLKRRQSDESLTALEYTALAVAVVVFAIIVFIFIKK